MVNQQGMNVRRDMGELMQKVRWEKREEDKERKGEGHELKESTEEGRREKLWRWKKLTSALPFTSFCSMLTVCCIILSNEKNIRHNYVATAYTWKLRFAVVENTFQRQMGRHFCGRRTPQAATMFL